ncbi:DASH complex, subunit Spc34 [Tothia fuscella]|uniref:DASH complex subunit SPC34 n=1 Tax=Tothia fuscella TaxID=1048955 RepID=A0A9P4P2V3_9PEZI|nr:DASH complex, subunit Spc34 [Tothia fuscella]
MSTTSLLTSHLDQISLCASSIGDLTFPPPKIFANALLHPHDITALIRDTETHERALFSVPPPLPLKAQDPTASTSNRRATTFRDQQQQLADRDAGVRAPRRNTAVAAVLGGELVERIRRGGGGGAGSGLGYRRESGGVGGRGRGEVDVDVLLEGAEKLCSVYPIPHAAEQITRLRQRHSRLTASINHYEARVAEQNAQLSRMNRQREYGSDYGGEDDAEDGAEGEEAVEDYPFTEEDMRREEEEVKELERKKRALEERVSGMEKDISGVLR